jgi:hypothetical protein
MDLCGVTMLTRDGTVVTELAGGQPVAPLDDEDEDLITTGYGHGMFTGTFAGHAAYYHPGDNPGYLSFAGWIPDRSASVVILANDASVEMVDQLRRLLPTAVEP